MSKRYEFLDDELAEVLTTKEAMEEFEGGIVGGEVALVIGNPYDCAGVLVGTKGQLQIKLNQYLQLLQ